jgi:putative ABC transport system substrate-binding protein
VDRRTFIAGTGAMLLAAPLAAEAQPAGKVYRIGLIGSGPPPPPPTDQGSLLSERLRELGWVYGRDFVVEQRAFGDRIERTPDLAAELIHTGVDIFVVEGATDAALVQQVTRTIPIVTLRAGDLVASGVAASLARPGGNVTGVQTLLAELAAKHLSLLKEAIPRLSRSGVLFGRSGASTGPLQGFNAAFLRAADAGGKALGIALQIVTFREGNELKAAFSAFHAERAQGVVVVRNQLLATHTKTLVDLALKHRLPTISDGANFSNQGGLMSYGFNFRDTVRSAADMVDKILRGAKAGEIPIQQAVTFQLRINLKTAKALGLTIPPSLLGRADEVIQ